MAAGGKGAAVGGSLYNFLFLFAGREGSSPIIDWLGNHPDVIVPLFEDLDWYNEDIRRYQPIHRLADLVYRYGDWAAAKESFATTAGLPAPSHVDKSIGFKWRIWADPTSIAAVLARHRVKVFHLFRENVLELAVSSYFSNVVIPQLEKEQGLDLGGGGHFQFALAAMDQQQQARYLARRSQIRFSVPPDVLTRIITDIKDTKQMVHDNYCAVLRAHSVPVFSLRYEDFVSDQERFFRAVCGELDMDCCHRHSYKPYFRKATCELLSQVVNLEQIAALPAVRSAMIAIRTLIYQRHQYLFETRRAAAGGK